MRGRRALALLVCLGASAGLTKPSPRTAKQDAVDAHLATARDVSSGKVAELDSHKGGESAGGNAIDALRHGDPVGDAPQTITSEAAAFDTEDIERVAGEGEALSGSTARNAAAEMVKSRLATQTTRPVFEQGFAGTRRRLSGECERPSGWCIHSGSTFTMKDCDGDGVDDPYCSDSAGFSGFRSSKAACADTWPNGGCKPINCGGHLAATCEECPEGNGAA